MTEIHFTSKEKGTTIKNFSYRTRLPVVGDEITMQTGKGNYNYIVLSRRFVYSWKKSTLLFVKIVLEKATK